MARTTGSSGPKTFEAIRAAGLALIYRHGYEAMSLRQLAAEVGIREGSLYNHIRSKQDLLFTLVDGHMDDLLAAMESALRGLDGPETRLRAFIAFHLRYHMQRKAEVFVINSELRSLDDANRTIIADKRSRYEKAVTAIFAEGQAQGVFVAHDAGIAAKAVLAMLTGVSTWFHENGRLEIDEIVAIHTDMVLMGTKITPPPRTRRPD